METVGQITTPKITLVPDGIKVYIAQLQPTSRPIEDRFSLNYDASRNRLIVGVYDGASDCHPERQVRLAFIHRV